MNEQKTSGLHMRTLASVHCHQCGKRIFDGMALTARVVLVGEHGSKAKCARCKTLVPVPVQWCPPGNR